MRKFVPVAALLSMALTFSVHAEGTTVAKKKLEEVVAATEEAEDEIAVLAEEDLLEELELEQIAENQ
jgi:hypothetical protein